MFKGISLQRNQKETCQKQNDLKELREHKMHSIDTRSKANWITKGEKSTKHSLNLEKRHYTNKLIPKLILKDATAITEHPLFSAVN